MYFAFLEDYVITPELIEEKGAKSAGRLRHLFYTLPESQIQEAINTFTPFPEELNTLYCEIGFGFMNRGKKGKFNSIFDPMTLIYTNKQINYFATPETANELKYYDIEKQLLFFKTLSNCYFAIDRYSVNGKNRIYYRGNEVDSSLYNFLKETHSGNYDLDMLIDSISAD